MTRHIEFETAAARALWNDYRRRLAWRDRELPPAERAERLREAESHIIEAMAEDSGNSEVARLERALEAFGTIAAPPAAWQAPARMLASFIVITLIAVSGLLALSLLHMAVMEAFNPNEVGLYWRDGDGWTLSYEAQPDSREVLGAWFIPAALAIAALLGSLVAILLRRLPLLR